MDFGLWRRSHNSRFIYRAWCVVFHCLAYSGLAVRAIMLRVSVSQWSPVPKRRSRSREWSQGPSMEKVSDNNKKKIENCWHLICAVCLIFTLPTLVSGELAYIPDPNLRNAIRQALQLPDEIPLTQREMLRLKHLFSQNSNITDLTGLEHATFLQDLNLHGNNVQDLKPIANLVHLDFLDLNFNKVSDISPLANLTNLKFINIGGSGKISDITVLANMSQLERINMFGNSIEDLTPLQNLTKLWELVANHNQIRDLTPLANLTNLKIIALNDNKVHDISPLANLINLEKLFIMHNPCNDFTPLQNLNLTDFQYDQTCDIPPPLPSVRERIESRSFPSIFQAWHEVGGFDVLIWEQRNVLHDLHWYPRFDYQIGWDITSDEPTYGLRTSLTGNFANADEVRQRRLGQNPNMIFLGGFANTAHPTVDAFPLGSDLWLRDENGQILTKRDGKLLIDFVKPEFQDLMIRRAIAFARCGLYDGIMLDEFNHHGNGFGGRHLYPYTDEEIIEAYTNVFQAIRSQVRDDFLIIVNAGRSKATRYAEFINGTFMETGQDLPDGYTNGGLYEIESTLLWSDQNLRYPQINCLEGAGIATEPPDSPNNLRWMRVFTTMSLTHSDGYVTYNPTYGEVNVCDECPFWYPFWDANLGLPVGPKAQRYQDINGLFIREFTNGWAVYNRSGEAQTITLSVSATPVSDRGNNAASPTHQLPDLDGEIYLTTRGLADVNGDGRVNILDFVQIANGFGKSAPDPNGDGAVNILDLVFVAQHFSE